MTHICVGKLTIIGSDYDLSPRRRQAIIWTNAGILLIGPLRTNFSEILIEIHTLSFKKMHLKMSSGKWQLSCLGNVLNIPTNLTGNIDASCPYGSAPAWLPRLWLPAEPVACHRASDGQLLCQRQPVHGHFWPCTSDPWARTLREQRKMIMDITTTEIQVYYVTKLIATTDKTLF